MSGTDEEGGSVETRRRRIAFRAWHRGIRETDLILGRFADAHVGAFAEAELGEFERLLDIPDRDLLGWVTGAETIPAEMASPMLRRIIAFHRG